MKFLNQNNFISPNPVENKNREILNTFKTKKYIIGHLTLNDRQDHQMIINVNGKTDIRDPNLDSYRETNIVFNVSCSKGTYIRVLGNEIAEKLGTVGHLNSLIRTSVGKYAIDDSVSLDQFKLLWKSYTH